MTRRRAAARAHRRTRWRVDAWLRSPLLLYECDQASHDRIAYLAPEAPIHGLRANQCATASSMRRPRVSRHSSRVSVESDAGEDLDLGALPERLRVDQEAVHVEEHTLDQDGRPGTSSCSSTLASCSSARERSGRPATGRLRVGGGERRGEAQRLLERARIDPREEPGQHRVAAADRIPNARGRWRDRARTLPCVHAPTSRGPSDTTPARACSNAFGKRRRFLAIDPHDIGLGVPSGEQGCAARVERDAHVAVVCDANQRRIHVDGQSRRQAAAEREPSRSFERAGDRGNERVRRFAVGLDAGAVELRCCAGSLLDDLEARARLARSAHDDRVEPRVREIAVDLRAGCAAHDHHGADRDAQRREHARDVDALAARLPAACAREMACSRAQLRDEAGPIDGGIRRDGHDSLHADAKGTQGLTPGDRFAVGRIRPRKGTDACDPSFLPSASCWRC